jgi:hypothetical protein
MVQKWLHAITAGVRNQKTGDGSIYQENNSSAKDKVRRWASDVLELRATVADLQLR